MTRMLIVTATLLALAACSTNHRLLAPDEGAKQITPHSHHMVKRGVDPVCGMSMDHAPADAFWHTSYQGTEYYFDSETCKRLFEENPDLYTSSVR